MQINGKLEKLRTFMKQNELSAVVVTEADNQFYFCNFKVRSYSRPLHLVITENETTLIVPGLEEVSSKAVADVNNVLVYYEHPEKEHEEKDSISTLLNYLRSISSQNKKLGIEFSSTSIKLESSLINDGWELIDTTSQIANQRAIKSQEEIQMMKEAGRLVSFAVGESINGIKEGITEIEIDSIGNTALFKEVSRVHPDATLGIRVMSPSGITRSIMPHVFSNTRKIQKGDVIIHTRQVEINGYRAECERTLFYGEPTKEQEKAFAVIVEAQNEAIQSIKAGVPMREIDLAARKVIQKAGFGEYAIHRTGHSIGITHHESPYIRYDEEQLLEENMVFTIEPGMYIPNLGGYRHSDTVIVTKNGFEMITDYPRKYGELIFKG
jgi:Xaa-Pro dipeptidase